MVYGFADKRDYDEYKPVTGEPVDDGPGFAAALTQKLDQLPISRWSRLMRGYVIEPKAK